MNKEFGRSSAEATLFGDTVNYSRGLSTETLLLIAAAAALALLVWFNRRK